MQIDGFGIFSAKKVKGMSSGLNIIYGPNEFGKTTLLEFIRCMLFGFPKKNQKTNFHSSYSHTIDLIPNFSITLIFIHLFHF